MSKSNALKAGTETGSLVNHVLSGANADVVPAVGMGATILKWTDREACTIIAVERNRDGEVDCVTVQADHAKRIDTNGMSDAQQYDYAANPAGATRTFRRDRKGAWRRADRNPSTGRWNLESGGSALTIGVRAHYHDFSF